MGIEDIHFIGGEASDEDCRDVSRKIIDLLERFNLADKVKIIGSLYRSLIDTIKNAGGVIEEKDEDSFS